MSRKSKLTGRRLPCSVVLLALAAGAARSWAQSDYLEQPPPPLTVPQLKYIDLNIEAEQSSSSGGSSHISYQRLYVAPTVGIGWDYFLYHPDLLTYAILAEPGYVWDESGSAGSSSKQSELLLNGSLNATLLQLKPYATTLFANASHNTSQINFYNSVVQDVTGFGGVTGYREGPVPFLVTFQKTTCDTTGFAYDSSSDQTALNLHAQNARSNGNNTDLTYQYQNMTWSTSMGNADTTESHYLTVNDEEHFKKSAFDTRLLFNQSDDANSSFDSLSLTLDYSVEHTPHLRSFYDYSFSRDASEGGNSTQHAASVGLQHQLYESLSSSLDVHGASSSSDYNGSTSDLLSAGMDASVNYSKRLGSWGHLMLGNSAIFEQTDQQSVGTISHVYNESVIMTNQPVRLSQSRVIAASVTVVDSATHLPLLVNVNYTLTQIGEVWEIQSVGPLDPFYGKTALVSYDFQPNPSGSYSTFSDTMQARLELWRGLADIHARYSLTDNKADSPGFVFENTEQFQAGADFNWKHLRLAADYTDSRSSLYSYYSYSTAETYSTPATTHSTLGINLRQQWSYYPSSGSAANPNNEVTYFDYMLRYEWSPDSMLNWNAETGLQQQRGNGQDQDLFAARTYLNWMVGKLNVHLGYEYENQRYPAEMRERHFVFLRVRRNF